MSDIINLPENESRWINDASINTEAWLKHIGKEINLEQSIEWDNDLEAWLFLNRLHNEMSNNDAEDAEVVQYRSRDNVYNHENDFSDIFTYTIYTVGDNGDYLYHDDAYVAVCLHRGGDARGNYGNVKLYRLRGSVADSGFLDWMLGWYVEDAVTGENLDLDGMYGIGYSNNPTHHLEGHFAKEDDDTPYAWKDGAFHAILETKNTERPTIAVRCMPYCNL
jgi:hypothetical protein